jgi:hypothetical protein
MWLVDITCSYCGRRVHSKEPRFFARITGGDPKGCS